MNLELKGKTALITGASSGIGEGFARCLSKAGVRVILASRRIDKLKSLAVELNDALPLEMDVSDKASVATAFEKIEKQGERIDISVNNAGFFRSTPVFDADEQNDFESVMQTNLIGLWYVTKASASHMKHNGIHGSIINIASVNGANFLGENSAAYCASKAAVIQLTKALVGELAKEHIRINCISPGLFHTPPTDPMVNTDTLRAKVENLIPLGFVPEPSGLDGTILYLASNQASPYVTGSCLTVDGGISWGGTSYF